uniref:TTF-type domain-containing protein n=1 Tax=Lygus hesperus TaxID=30085 RepID=A0A0K8SEV2_LYGHE
MDHSSLDHFMVKRRKPNDDGAASDDAGACDSTYQQEDEGGSPPDVKVDKEILDEAMRHYNEQVERSFRESPGTTPTELPEFPYQPEDVPPYRDRRRPHLFQKKWYKEYPWLHYDVASQSMFCFQCLSAVIRKVADCPPNMQNIFARGGFKNWKKGIERFRVHENSQLHKDTLEFSVKRLFGLKEKCAGVESIMSSVNYLVGVGYDTQRPCLMELLFLRKNELPQLSEHLSKTSFSTSDERELLSIMTSSTMRAVSVKIKEAGPYGLVLEKLNLFDKTLFAVTARVSRFTKTDELYLGMYTKQNILHELVNYLDADDLRIYFSDMADSSSIAGALDKIQPSALSIHCPNHNLCLDLQDVLKKSARSRSNADGAR